MDKIKTKQDNLREDYQVVKGNILNEGKLCSKTTLVEYRILLVALSKVSPITKSLSVYFRAEDFCKLLNIRKDGMYSYIKKAARNLASRTITYENKKEKKFVTYPWLSEINYDDAFISINFNSKLEKYIIDIKENGGYTKYFVRNILKLRSIYAVRLYELIKQYEKIGHRKISLNGLREKIGATKKTYEKMFLFRRELNKLKDDINICTDLIFDYEEIKDGRMVKDIVFHIQSKVDLSNDYKILRKDKLILLIQREIHNRTGHIFEAYHMNSLHRNILLDLLEKLKSRSLDNLFIRNPENFFIHQLDEMQKNYNLALLYKRFEDY